MSTATDRSGGRRAEPPAPPDDPPPPRPALHPRPLPLLSLLIAAACAPPGGEPASDRDGDGFPDASDCRPDDPDDHPGAPEAWDGLDNDCNGAADDGYRTVAEAPEDRRGHAVVPDGGIPEESGYEDCWYGGDVRDLGLLAEQLSEPVFVEGRIDWVAAREVYSYDVSDSDCWSFRLPEEGWVHALLEWEDAGTDVDLVVFAPWVYAGETEPERAIFAEATGTNALQPPPLEVTTSATFEPGTDVFAWVVGYSGAPTAYTMALWATAP